MNLLRTIQRTEQQDWIDTLFTAGPYPGKVAPLYPRQLPFPFRLRQNVAGGTVYLVYKGTIIAYGAIAQVTYMSSTRPVGSQLQPVKPGDNVILRGAYSPMPTILAQVQMRGFMGPRYTHQDLHTLSAGALRKALDSAGVIVY